SAQEGARRVEPGASRQGRAPGRLHRRAPPRRPRRGVHRAAAAGAARDAQGHARRPGLHRVRAVARHAGALRPRAALRE
ncbi:unnamed protein product, partial [Prorocentrum cordatum]